MRGTPSTRVVTTVSRAIGVATGRRHGPRVDKGGRWDAAEVGPAVDKLLAEVPDPVYGTG